MDLAKVPIGERVPLVSSVASSLRPRCHEAYSAQVCPLRNVFSSFAWG